MMGRESTTILVVDDDRDQLDVFRLQLGDVGFLVEVATDGIDALSYLYAARPAMVLMDLSMPRMNGVEMIAQVRSDPALEHLTIIAMSGADELLQRALAAGANHALRKPFSTATLLRAVARSSPQTVENCP